MKFEIVGSKQKSVVEAYEDVNVNLQVNGLQAALIKVMIDRVGDKMMLELLERGNSIREGELASLIQSAKTGIEMSKIMKPLEWSEMVNAVDREARRITGAQG